VQDQLIDCLEFQVRGEDADQWESLIRFFLEDEITKVLAHQDPSTQSGVAAVLDDIYQESLYIPEDGRRFFNTVAAWQEGTRHARVISCQLTSVQAHDITSLSAATQVEPVDATIELIGQAQEPVPQPHSESASRP
jgi:hypothetical protein